ncbi:hypothetical protein MUK42_15589 [Musa troglodytarum]|uniref:Uncharacterized protein n=1 Tax=Musa troglodytarum TaxID=320322 RepID=A0A9E7KMU2_9LILI|nr:hypothetical protein MUK42_15589 [Musa troglodytarum]
MTRDVPAGERQPDEFLRRTHYTSHKIPRCCTFNFLSRGVPFPPSGPSKGHNSIPSDQKLSP